MEFTDYLIETAVFAQASQIASRVNRSSKNYPPGQFGSEIEFVPQSEDHEEEINRWTGILSSMGADVERNTQDQSWSVSDSKSLMKITTPSLMLKELAFLKQVIERMSHEKFSQSTFANLRIGIPNKTDPFDLLSLMTLIAEAQTRMGKKSYFEDFLYEKFSYGEMDVHDLEEFFQGIKSELDDNIQSFLENGTIEFRYPSSQIVNNSEVFCNWIEYFLLLPRVARSRQQISLKTSQGSLVLSRQSGGKIQIDKVTKNLGEAPPKALGKEELVLQKLGRLTFRDIGNKMPPQSQTHMTVVLRNRYPGRDMTRTPISQVWRDIPQSLRQMITQSVSE